MTKVLMLAWVANPDEGSEPGIGWAFARAAAERHDVHLVVGRPGDARAIDSVLTGPGAPRITLHEAERPAWTLRFGRRWHFQASVFLAQPFAAKQVARLVREHDIDVVHHVTFTNDWMPSAAMLTRFDAPLVWGPVGGSGAPPVRHWKWMGPTGVVKETKRAIVGAATRALTNSLAGRAASILVTNREAARAFASHEPLVESYVALDPEELLPLRQLRRSMTPERANRDRRLALFGGRLLPYKGLRLAIEALTAPGAEHWDLRVIGDGPQREQAERLVRRLGLEARVEFEDALPRAQFLREIARSDALLMPSLHEAGGWVYAEAGAIGTPVVCLDFAGPSLLLDPADGHQLIPLEGDLRLALGTALGAIPESAVPDDRWWHDRLAGVLDDLYRSVISDRSHVALAG